MCTLPRDGYSTVPWSAHTSYMYNDRTHFIFDQEIAALHLWGHQFNNIYGVIMSITHLLYYCVLTNFCFYCTFDQWPNFKYNF